jgi:hypothetical protein
LVVGAGGLLPSMVGDLRLPPQGGKATGGEPEVPAPPSPAAMLGRLAAGTVLVLALCAGTLPLLKRWLVAGSAARGEAAAGGFEIVATLPLGGRSCVCLVRAGGQHLLAGTDGAGLQALVAVGDVPVERVPAPAPAPVARRIPAGAGIDPRRVGAV